MRYLKIDLAGAIVLITGGGHGIGAATARRFGSAGAVVCIGDIDTRAAAATAQDLGSTTHSYPLDVTNPDSFETVVHAVLDRFGQIDVLVNNAGVMPLGDFLSSDDAINRATVDINVFGLINGMRSVLPHMIERGRGHVVNVCSMAGKIPIPGMAVYNASKFAAVGLTAAVREEYRATGVSISAVLPAAVHTRLSSGVPLGHGLPTVEPDDVAHAIVSTVVTRTSQLAVPSYLGAWDLIEAITPAPLLQIGRRLVGDRRALTKTDQATRSRYEKTISTPPRLPDKRSS